MEKETTQVYYVWYDLLMEEHFSMLAHELDNNFVKMKEQLLSEKNVFHKINATSSMEAISLFKESKKTINEEVVDVVDNPVIEASAAKRRSLH